MGRGWIRMLGLWIAIIVTFAACGASGEESGEDEAAAPDLAYEIIESSKIPQKLAEKIAQEQKEKFGASKKT